MFSILTRTSNRPNFFRTCRQSVLDQTVTAFHLIATDDEAGSYPEGDRIITVEKQQGRAHNLYFNTMRWWVPQWAPWVIHLDDDDQFTSPHALGFIRQHIKTENDLVLWQVDLGNPGPVIPRAFGKQPRKGDISGIGFAVHVRHWEPWQGIPCGDYEVITRYYNKLNPVWIRQVLTSCQAGAGHGDRRDKTIGEIL